MTTSPTNRDRIDWVDLDELATAYVAGALTEAESTAFESQLAEDQAAREAVARGVELVAAAHAALQHEPVCCELKSTSTLRRDRFEWAASVACALLIVGVLCFGYRQEQQRRLADSGLSPVASLESDQLALIWSEIVSEAAHGDATRSVEDVAQTAVGFDPLFTADLAESDLAIELVGGDRSQGGAEADADEDEGGIDFADSPDWMLAAVGELRARDEMNREREREVQ